MRSGSFVLTELANRPYEYYLSSREQSKEFPGSIDYNYEFVTDKKITYDVTIRISKRLFQSGKTVWLGFGAENQETQGDQFRILSTVLTILKKFLAVIDDPSIDQISFNFDDLRRQKFYSRFVGNIGRYLPGWQLKDQGASWFSFKPIENVSESTVEGLLIDLTQNFQNYRSLVGQILDQGTNGKIRIQIVSADPRPGAKSTLAVGTVLKISPNYLKKAKVLTKDDLNEVKMSPKELRKWATGQDAKQVKVGFELEMVFPNTPRADEDPELEPDYSMDESVDNIEDAVDFFSNGNNPISRRDQISLRSNLYDDYRQWLTSEADDSWDKDEFYNYMYDNEREDLLDEFRAEAAEELDLDVNTQNLEQISEIDALAEEKFEDKIEESWDSQDEYYDRGFEDHLETVKADKSESEWFDNEGISSMKDIADMYNIEWPYLEDDEDYEQAWEVWARSLSRAIGGERVDISGSYHGAGRNHWVLEHDSSITPDNRNDAGIEVISPPMPMDEALNKLNQVLDWANSNSIYTNQSTGLHINISTMRSAIDYVKLILFMGDQYILKQFGREASSFASSAIEMIKSNVARARERIEEEESVYSKPIDIVAAMDLMRKQLIELASRYVQQGVGTDKYTSAHIRHTSSGHTWIEFRGPGNDYLQNQGYTKDIIDNTVLRLSRAMIIAGEPSYEREEYGKKLYKLLSGTEFETDPTLKTVVPKINDTIAKIFSDYSAGISSSDVVKRQWAKEVLERYRKDRIRGTGNDIEYEVYVPDTNQVIDRFLAKNDADAVEQASLVHSGQGYNYQIRPADGQMTKRQELAKRILSVPRIYYVAPTEYGQKQKGFYVNATNDQLAIEKAIDQAGDSWKGITKRQIASLPLGVSSGISMYTVSYPESGDLEVDVYADSPVNAIKIARHETFRANNFRDAKFVVKLIKQNAQVPIQNTGQVSQASQTVDIGEPRPNTTRNPDANWAIVRRSNGEIVLPFIKNTQQEAEKYFQDWAKSRIGSAGDYQLVPLASGTQAQGARVRAGTPGTGEWTGAWIIQTADGYPLHKFHGIGNVQADANRHAQRWLAQNGYGSGMEVEVVPEMR